jgi:hypothetical protein
VEEVGSSSRAARGRPRQGIEDVDGGMQPARPSCNKYSAAGASTSSLDSARRCLGERIERWNQRAVELGNARSLDTPPAPVGVGLNLLVEPVDGARLLGLHGSSRSTPAVVVLRNQAFQHHLAPVRPSWRHVPLRAFPRGFLHQQRSPLAVPAARRCSAPSFCAGRASARDSPASVVAGCRLQAGLIS